MRKAATAFLALCLVMLAATAAKAACYSVDTPRSQRLISVPKGYVLVRFTAHLQTPPAAEESLPTVGYIRFAIDSFSTKLKLDRQGWMNSIKSCRDDRTSAAGEPYRVERTWFRAWARTVDSEAKESVFGSVLILPVEMVRTRPPVETTIKDVVYHGEWGKHGRFDSLSLKPIQ